MKSLRQFINEHISIEPEMYSWSIEFTKLPINEAKTSTTGIVIDAKDHPLYKERTKPEQELASDEDYQKAYSAYKKGFASDESKERVPFEDGKVIGVRLNLNATDAAKRAGYPAVKVLTAHSALSRNQIKAREKAIETGKPLRPTVSKHLSGSTLATNPVINNMHTVTLRNAHFNVNQTKRSYVANKIQKLENDDPKEDKNPLASVDGEYVDKEPDFNGVLAKFNPGTNHLFVDGHGYAIKSAGEATMHADGCYLRGPIEFHTAKTAPRKLGDSTSNTRFMSEE